MKLYDVWNLLQSCLGWEGREMNEGIDADKGEGHKLVFVKAG